MNETITAIMTALVEHFGVGGIDELPFVETNGGYRFDVEGVGSVLITEDDTVISVFEMDQYKLVEARAEFTWHKPARVAAFVAAALDEMLANY